MTVKLPVKSYFALSNRTYSERHSIVKIDSKTIHWLVLKKINESKKLQINTKIKTKIADNNTSPIEKSLIEKLFNSKHTEPNGYL